MLRSFGLGASRLLAPQPDAIAELEAALDDGWRTDALPLLAGGWRDQVTAAAAIALRGADEPLVAALWLAIDGSSWVAPQLVAAALRADGAFESRAAERLGDATRRAPKTIGALVRAYTRCESKRMPVMAQLGVHDRTMATEEARIGVRGVDGWLDYFSSRSS
ncbi:MAG: hypothetical protein ACXVAN_10950 [Polyangia bacterium]